MTMLLTILPNSQSCKASCGVWWELLSLVLEWVVRLTSVCPSMIPGL